MKIKSVKDYIQREIEIAKHKRDGFPESKDSLHYNTTYKRYTAELNEYISKLEDLVSKHQNQDFKEAFDFIKTTCGKQQKEVLTMLQIFEHNFVNSPDYTKASREEAAHIKASLEEEKVKGMTSEDIKPVIIAFLKKEMAETREIINEMPIPEVMDEAGMDVERVRTAYRTFVALVEEVINEYSSGMKLSDAFENAKISCMADKACDPKSIPEVVNGTVSVFLGEFERMLVHKGFLESAPKEGRGLRP